MLLAKILLGWLCVGMFIAYVLAIIAADLLTYHNGEDM